ncbi:c-type cytochrome biogenesis protein CcmI [Marinibaculum pumilum]|uniref:C-type cytochrome biogenesis protein CcmI n=1 Tax=Marinibaculum pumilum TaxID=1766165 RepID=A0ABV7KYP4_9PROT
MFWLIIGLLAAAVAVALVLPLVLARRQPLPDAAAHDRAVYRDQLAEVERDLARGVLDESAAAAARVEIQRRILRTDREAPEKAAGTVRPGGTGRPGGPAGLLAVFLAVLVPLAGLGLYFQTGTPGMPDMPLAMRGPGPDAAQMRAASGMDPEARAEMIAGMVAGLEERLAEMPDDFDGWMRLGRSRLVLGEPMKARDAYARASALRPDSLPAATAYAAAVMQSDGAGQPVSPQAEAALKRVLEIAPEEPSALFLLGRAASERGDWPAAMDWFGRLAGSLPDSDPRAPVVDRILEELRQRGTGPDRSEAGQGDDAGEAAQPSPQR